jgi:hypothetical protein
MAKLVTCERFETAKVIEENQNLRLIAAIPTTTRSPIGDGKTIKLVQLYFEKWSTEDKRVKEVTQ